MSALYLLTSGQLLLLLLLLTAAVLVQAGCTVFGFFRLSVRRDTCLRGLLDFVVLLHLIVLTACCGSVLQHSHDGFLIRQSWPWARRLLTCVMALLAVILSIRTRDLLPLSIPLTAALTLPAAEYLTGHAFLIVVVLACSIWLFLSTSHLLICVRDQKAVLSIFSVKEAVDSLDFGLLFLRAEGLSKGQILLTNTKMQQLMFTLTGQLLCSGSAFYERLVSGQVLPACHRDGSDPHLVYTLPDGSVWLFERQDMTDGRRACALLVASDITAQAQAASALVEQNAQLSARNQELKTMLQNLETTCWSEELLHAKSRVHDLLGQQISLILRSVREHREPDEVLLASFADGLLKDLRSTTVDCGHSLRQVAKSFEKLGVQVHIDGKLPPDPRLQKTFFEISAEAMTNAVHHGYATEIWISMALKNGRHLLTITDSGTPPRTPIVEGGGLQEMRRKVQALHGSFSYEPLPHFTIFIEIPGGDAL